MRKLFLCLLILSGAANAWAQLETKAAHDLRMTESNFAKTAGEKGTKAAFLQFAADRAIMFDPAPVNAQEIWRKRAESIGLLTWRPTWVDATPSGQLGYTTGPWEYSPKGKNDAPSAFGEFVTIWEPQRGGTWKFVLDFGIDHAKPEGGDIQKSAELKALITKESERKPFKSMYSWDAVEANFTRSNQQNGMLKAYDKLLSEQARVLRQNHFPFVGKKSALEILKVESGNLKTKLLGGNSTEDLAYSYGEYELTMPNEEIVKGYYLRVWKMESKEWQIVLDLTRPLPAKSK